MDVRTNIPLKNFTTMKLGGNARFMTDVFSKEDVRQLHLNAQKQNLPVFTLGGGSNTIVKDEGFNGIVMRMRIPGFEVESDDIFGTTIKVGAGENWDDVVKKTVEMGLSGIEAMSGIPGTVGAAPVQNIGAYGQEIADKLIFVNVYDHQAGFVVTKTNQQCKFSYRDSIFRGEAKGLYTIVDVTLRLHKSNPEPPFYSTLQTYLDEHQISHYTPQVIRDAVLAIREDKLPDPDKLPNAGSFFKNTIIDEWQLNELLKEYDDMPHYEMGDKRYKIPTGWLIEQAGKKGQLINGIRVHDKNCLVLINESASSYSDLDAARSEIIGAVRDKFRIAIEQEPLEL